MTDTTSLKPTPMGMVTSTSMNTGTAMSCRPVRRTR